MTGFSTFHQRFGGPRTGNLCGANWQKAGPRLANGIAVLAAMLVLAGCSSANSGLTTGSLLPGAAKPAADPVSERALQVGATSARAAKCGYNFDPQKLRTSYVAFEAGQPGADPIKVEKIFDTARASVASKIPDPAEYCTDEQTSKIKSDLTRHLAGDYNPPAKKVEATLADVLAAKDQKPYDPKDALCPNKACY